MNGTETVYKKKHAKCELRGFEKQPFQNSKFQRKGLILML